MTTEQKMKIQSLASDVITTILGEFEEHRLAAHEKNAGDMVSRALVEWNRGKQTKEALGCVSAAANDILAAVRTRRKELRDGKTSV